MGIDKSISHFFQLEPYQKLGQAENREIEEESKAEKPPPENKKITFEKARNTSTSMAEWENKSH